MAAPIPVERCLTLADKAYFKLAAAGIGSSAHMPSAQPLERFEPTAGDTQ